MTTRLRLTLPLLSLVLGGCGAFSSGLPTTADPLENMEVTRRTHFQLPQDEQQRQKLPLGVFTGVEVQDSRQTLQAQLGAPQGVLVTRIVENSPAILADLRVGDILAEAAIDGHPPVALVWPSDWHKLEQAATVTSTLHIVYDRAGRDGETQLAPVKRLSPAARLAGDHFREEAKVGVIIRNASEVEAHRAGLARGEGCVVIGLARTSPWRRAGVHFGDVIVAISGKPIKNPQELLAAINAQTSGDELSLVVFRDGDKMTLNTTVSRREREVTRFNIPLIYSYEHHRGIKKQSVLLGLYSRRKTAVASRTTWFWLIHTTVGDANRLEETK